MVRNGVWRAGCVCSFPHGCGDGPGLSVSIKTRTQFSPRVWGWSEERVLTVQALYVFPTGVGMVRFSHFGHLASCSFPHGCGDGPYRFHRQGYRRSVFPTGVGMVRTRGRQAANLRSFPHGCGDGPMYGITGTGGHMFSPRVWGWSGHAKRGLRLLAVFPTGVGMVRDEYTFKVAAVSFPHGCGDGPPSPYFPLAMLLFSPRVWGWSGDGRDHRRSCPVFPTGVGMVRSMMSSNLSPKSFPHGCGDGPRI